ncbi:MAG: hypothetical protein ITG02_08150, partial [Patulibacter sp.]|nr:hypothetical protein [Patulibacter sp.]
MSRKTKAQQTYERIEALIEGGASKGDAYRQLAAEYGQPVESVRGAYSLGRRQVTGETSTRGRSRKKRETTAEDAIERAVIELESSIEAIQQEVDASRVQAEEAQAAHETLK